MTDWTRGKIESIATRVAEAGDAEAAKLIRDLLAVGIEAEQEAIDATTALEAAREDVTRLVAEVEKWKHPCQEFLDKTEWVQHTGTARELGHHRADILRDRIKQAEARAERLAVALRKARARIDHVVHGEAGMETLHEVHDLVTAALHPTAAQEKDGA